MKVHIITIGDEILIGQIVDTNSAWMAQQLNEAGARVTGITTVSDTKEAIMEAMETASKDADVVLMTGGLGPTKDDLTKNAIADFFEVGFVFHQGTWDKIVKLFERWGREYTPAHREQCFMPQNALILHNKMGTAPGMWFEEKEKVFVSMPGVPYEMKYLMEAEVIPKLKERFPQQPIAHRTILTVGEGESRLAQRIVDFENNLPENIKLAYLPGLGSVRLRLTGIDDDEVLLNGLLDQKVAELQQLIPEFIYGYGEETLEGAVGKLLLEKNKTLATAESCTGGMVAHKITSVPGSSDYFIGSVIAYDNRIKMEQLGVQETTLKAHGAVSEAVVKEMVTGAIELLKADIAVAISGIAGPSGGTPEKPVGTIFLAVGDKNQIRSKKLQLSKDRMKNIEYSAVQALNMIRKFCNEF